MSLESKRVAILLAPRGTEEPEFAKPKAAVEAEGATVTVIGLETGKGETVNDDLDASAKHDVDTLIGSVSADDFDALIVPGGTVGADKLRADEGVVRFVKAFFEQGKPVAAICHAPWVLIEAGVVKGRRLTSFPSVKTDLENAGATWEDAEVVVDGRLVTSRKPDDIPAFNKAIVELFGQGATATRSAA